MPTSHSRDELESIVHRELTQLGLTPEKLKVDLGDKHWWIEIEITGRRFEIGSVYRDGFSCTETTAGRSANFTADCAQPIGRSDDHLRFGGLQMVRYALDHPDFRGSVQPIV